MGIVFDGNQVIKLNGENWQPVVLIWNVVKLGGFTKVASPIIQGKVEDFYAIQIILQILAGVQNYTFEVWDWRWKSFYCLIYLI